MNDPKPAEFTERRFADDYRLEYASLAGSKPGEWFGTFRVWKGNVKIADATLNTPGGGPGMAQTMAHNVGLSMMETYKKA